MGCHPDGFFHTAVNCERFFFFPEGVFLDEFGSPLLGKARVPKKGTHSSLSIIILSLRPLVGRCKRCERQWHGGSN